MIKDIENVILLNKSVNWYSQLKDAIYNSKKLSDSDIELFNLIWKDAIDFSNWNYSDLVLGCKTTHQRLKKSYDLSDECIGIIVNVASYDWK
jgi:hypothetical protein